MNTRTLLIDERVGTTDRLRIGLELEGHELSVATDARAALARLQPGAHDLVILAGPAESMTRRVGVIRQRDEHVLLIALALDGDETDLVMGLRFGADAYVIEPVNVLELLARIEALLRRYRRMAAPPSPPRRGMLRLGDIELHRRSGAVYKSGVQVALSPKELAVFVALARRHGGVARRTELLREVWGNKFSATTRTVDVHIAELRRKLEDDASRPRIILTERKLGYRLSS